MRNKFHQHLFVDILNIPNFREKWKPGKKFNFAGFLEKLFLLITHEPMKVPWCFICQKNSRDVVMTWLKAHVLQATCDNAIP